jgi:hypothetical protein
LGLEGTFGRSFGVRKTELLDAKSSSAVLHAVIRYSTAVLDLGSIEEAGLHEKSQN